MPNGLAIDHNGNVYVTGRSQGKETNDDYTTAGKLVEKRTGLPSSGTLQTGNNFPQGIYFAEIVQGTDRLVLKLVKN